MFERPTRILWSAIIALTFVSFRRAHAAEASRTLFEAQSASALSDVKEAPRETLTENPTIATNGSDGADVIEEIVVVGNKKKQPLNPDRILTTRLEKPSRSDLRLLPAYDPQEANRYFSLVQHDERLGHVGILTLFRLNFGR